MMKVISHEDAERSWRKQLKDRVEMGLPGARSVVLKELEGELASGFGGIAFLMSMLERSGEWDAFLQGAPLAGQGNNATKTSDLLKTLLACVLAGGNRFRHAEHLKRDRLLAELLGAQLCGEDALCRGLGRMSRKGGREWASKHLLTMNIALLKETRYWVMDLDTTIKTLYGHQGGAEIGYNPHKRGHKGHAIHTVSIGGARLLLHTEVLPGNQTTPSFAMSGILATLDELISQKVPPDLVRADVAYGNDSFMRALEARSIKYLFRLRMSKRVQDLCRHVLERKVAWEVTWQDCGRNWRGCDTELKLQSWESERRVIILARPKDRPVAIPALTDQKGSGEVAGSISLVAPAKARKTKAKKADGPQQLILDLRFDEATKQFIVAKAGDAKAGDAKAGDAKAGDAKAGEILPRKVPLPIRIDLVAEDPDRFEFMVLVTNKTTSSLADIAAEYRRRGDAENPYDQLKNQQGWAGFNSHDLGCSSLAISLCAIIHNWSTVYSRNLDPEQTTEGVTLTPAVMRTPVVKVESKPEPSPPAGTPEPQKAKGRIPSSSILRLCPVGNMPLLIMGIIATVLFTNGESDRNAGASHPRKEGVGWADLCLRGFQKHLLSATSPPPAAAPPQRVLSG
jgi:hypothetical protein